jgi:transposase
LTTLKETGMRKFIGIDLHSNNSVVVVADDDDQVVYQKRLPNDLAAIAAALAPHREETVGVVIESTYNWYWLVDGLMEAGYRVHLAHPAAIKKYEGIKHSGDFADAAYLAQLLRLGLLAEGYVYPREQRGARDLARKRMQLVRYRTAQVLSIEGILMRQTGSRLKGEAVKRLTAAQVDEFGFAPDVALALEANRAVSQALGQQIEVLCVDSVRESNGKKKGEGNTRNGNKYLSWAFVEAANFALRYCPQARSFYDRKKSRTNRIVAIKALAHKLARACYHILREQRPFDVNRCFA